MTIVLLHGFFGSPDDWDPVTALFPPSTDVIVPDLSVVATREDIVDMPSFAAWLIGGLRARNKRSVVLAGYSLGGRLAVETAIHEQAAGLVESALLVSVHPGLLADDSAARDEREERWRHDKIWSERIKVDSWIETMAAWDAQPVLRPGSRAKAAAAGEIIVADAASTGPSASSSARHRRDAWSRAMRIWSLAKQPDRRDDLRVWSRRHQLTFLTGAEDAKFTRLAADLAAKTSADAQPIRHRIVTGAGHRVLREAPSELAIEIMRLAVPLGI